VALTALAEPPERKIMKLTNALSLTLTCALAVAVLSPVPVRAQSTCAKVVEMARDNISLRIQGGDNSANSRESAKVHLDAAALAAANGDEDRCWQLIQWSGNLIGVPGPVAVVMHNAMTATASAPQPPVVEPKAPGILTSYEPR
jgi:hypothetical protein